MPTKRLRLKYIKTWDDTKLPFLKRTRHRESGETVCPIKYPYESAEWWEKCLSICAAWEAKQKPKIVAKSDTFGALILAYQSDEDAYITRLAPRTKKDYQAVFKFLEPYYGESVAQLERHEVFAIAKAAKQIKKWKFANTLISVLSQIFKFAIDTGRMKENHAYGMTKFKRPTDLPDMNRPWEPHEVEAVLEFAPDQVAGPLLFTIYTGLAIGDVLDLPRSAVRDGAFQRERSKTGNAVAMPLPQRVLNMIAEMPDHESGKLFITSKGQPWATGFNASFAKARDPIVANGTVGKGLTAYGLRHTAAVILREMGYSLEQVAEFLGQSTAAMAAYYSKYAVLTEKMAPLAADLASAIDPLTAKSGQLRQKSGQLAILEDT